jgi:hypothetical protein
LAIKYNTCVLFHLMGLKLVLKLLFDIPVTINLQKYKINLVKIPVKLLYSFSYLFDLMLKLA